MSENRNVYQEWCDHWNSVAEFQRHRAAQIDRELELPITDAERTAGESGGFGMFLVGTVLLSTVAGVIIMGLINVARTISP